MGKKRFKCSAVLTEKFLHKSLTIYILILYVQTYVCCLKTIYSSASSYYNGEARWNFLTHYKGYNNSFSVCKRHSRAPTKANASFPGRRRWRTIVFAMTDLLCACSNYFLCRYICITDNQNCISFINASDCFLIPIIHEVSFSYSDNLQYFLQEHNTCIRAASHADDL